MRSPAAVAAKDEDRLNCHFIDTRNGVQCSRDFNQLSRGDAYTPVRDRRRIAGAGAAGGAGGAAVRRLDELQVRFRTRGERRSRAQGHRARHGQGEAAAVPLSDLFRRVGGGRAGRPAGDDGRYLLHGRRACAFPARRGADLRHAAGQAESHDRRGRRRHRGLDGAALVAFRSRPGDDREADRDGRRGDASPRRRRAHSSAVAYRRRGVGKDARRPLAHGRGAGPRRPGDEGLRLYGPRRWIGQRRAEIAYRSASLSAGHRDRRKGRSGERRARLFG